MSNLNELKLNKEFYPENIIDLAISDFNKEVIINKKVSGNFIFLFFNNSKPFIKEEFANYALALYKQNVKTNDS